MTPRTVVVGFQEDTTVSQVLEHQDKLRFSRFPIWSDSADNINGLVLKHDLLMSLARGEKDTPLSALRREILTIPESTQLPDLLNQMLKSKDHAALLTGEFGGTAGIVTLEDVVETILGMEIMDEIDAVEDMQKLARKTWEDRARNRGLDVSSKDSSKAETETTEKAANK